MKKRTITVIAAALMVTTTAYATDSGEDVGYRLNTVRNHRSVKDMCRGKVTRHGDVEVCHEEGQVYTYNRETRWATYRSSAAKAYAFFYWNKYWQRWDGRDGYFATVGEWGTTTCERSNGTTTIRNRYHAR